MTLPNKATLHDYVTQSNLIEGIMAEPGEPLFDNHYEAVLLVVVRAEAGHPRLLPRALHRQIMASEPDATPGRYREMLPMIVTSNVPLAQLEDRVASRLRGGGVVAVFSGPDRRLSP